MTWKLLEGRRGVNRNTDTVLTRLLALTWEAAVPPAVSAIANIAVFLVLVSYRPLRQTSRADFGPPDRAKETNRSHTSSCLLRDYMSSP